MRGSVQIAPSILSADFMALGADIAMISDAGADWVHVDVMDGHFVPNLTIGVPHVAALKKHSSVPLDVHLMIDNPEIQVPWYIDAGADLVTVHYEACDSPVELLESIRSAGVKAGISINPETPVEVLDGIVAFADLILIMSVHPGFGGQSFIEEAPGRITHVCEACDRAGVSPFIEVDGGINVSTGKLCADAGADVLVAGSAIFGADDPAIALREIRDAASR